MPARVFASLLATDSGRLTAAELAGLLHVSAAAVSGAVSYLVQVNLASREAEPGSRREHYRVHSETWYEALARKDQVLDRCERSLREGIDVVCGTGVLRILKLQLPGRKPLPAGEFLRGQRLDGTRFGNP